MGLKHVWIKLRDTLRFKWAKSKFDFTPSGAVDKFSFASCHHVVVLKLDGKLGDTQVMSHFYASLRAQSPRIMLSVVCSPNLASIYKDILGFDQVLVASRKPKSKEIIELCHKIKAATPVSAVGSIAGKIDLVVTTEPNFRPRDFIFNYELAPRYVAGCETKVDSVNLLIYNPYKRSKSVAECFVDLMDLGHLQHGKIAYQRLVTPESLAKMRKWLHLPEQLPDSIDLARAANEAEDDAISPREQRFLLAINPRGAARSRSFSDEFIITLIQELQAQFGSANGLEAAELLPGSEDCDASNGAEVAASDDATAVKQEAAKVADTEAASSLSEIEDMALTKQACASANKDALATNPLKISRDLEFVLLTPPHADDLKQKVKAAAVNCGASVFFLPEDSTVLDLSSTIDLCDALITVDTSTVHLACASHRPQLCVYAGTDLNNAILWAPLDPLAEVVTCEGKSIPEIADTILLPRAISFVRRLISD